MSSSTMPENNTYFVEMFEKLLKEGVYDLEEFKTEIAEQIWKAMEQQNVSKAELARRLGKSRAYITQILQGGANFTLESLLNIAKALECTLELRLHPKQSQRVKKDLHEYKAERDEEKYSFPHLLLAA